MGFFADGWSRVKLTGSTPASTQSGFTVVIASANIPAPVFADATDGGGDLRIATDADGNNQLPLQVVTWIQGSSLADLRTRFATYSSSDRELYLFYNKTGEVQPSVTDTFGRNAVWSDFEAVLHLSETSGNGTAGEFVDSTGNSNDATLTTGSSISGTTTGHPWGGSWLDLTGAESITLTGSKSMLDSSPMSLSFIANFDVVSNGVGALGNRNSISDDDWFQAQTDGRVFVKSGGEDLAEGDISSGSLVVFHATHDSSALITYRDGIAIASDISIVNPTGIVGFADYRVGTYFDDRADFRANGRMGEIRARKSSLSADLVLLESQNLSSPAAFWATGTPEVPSSVTIPVIMNHLRNQGIS